LKPEPIISYSIEMPHLSSMTVATSLIDEIIEKVALSVHLKNILVHLPDYTANTLLSMVF
jgi:hypothetical protein